MNSFYSNNELSMIGFKKLGKNVLISRKASFYSPEKMIIGDHVRIDDFCILSGKISLGNYVHIAASTALYGDIEGIKISDYCNVSGRVAMYAVSDDYSGEYLTNPMVEEKYKNTQRGKIVLKRHVIIGTNCTILPGVVLEEGASIGAMSLVKNDIPAWTINAGIPCRVIKERSKKLLDYAQLHKTENENNG